MIRRGLEWTCLRWECVCVCVWQASVAALAQAVPMRCFPSSASSCNVGMRDTTACRAGPVGPALAAYPMQDDRYHPRVDEAPQLCVMGGELQGAGVAVQRSCVVRVSVSMSLEEPCEEPCEGRFGRCRGLTGLGVAGLPSDPSGGLLPSAPRGMGPCPHEVARYGAEEDALVAGLLDETIELCRDVLEGSWSVAWRAGVLRTSLMEMERGSLQKQYAMLERRPEDLHGIAEHAELANTPAKNGKSPTHVQHREAGFPLKDASDAHPKRQGHEESGQK